MKSKRVFSLLIILLVGLDFIGMVVALALGQNSLFVILGTILLLLCVCGWIFLRSVRPKESTEEKNTKE